MKHMKPVRFLAVSAVAGLFAFVGAAGAALLWRAGPDSPGVGGAGAFIPSAHVNGSSGLGGPCAGIGGAGAFIPRTRPAVCGG